MREAWKMKISGSRLKQGTRKKYAFGGGHTRETVPTEDPCSCWDARSLLLGSFEHITCVRGVNCMTSSTDFENILKHLLECLQNDGQMCFLLWGASTWQSAGDWSISNISRGIASLWIVRKEIHVSGLTGAYSHPAVVTVTYHLWSVPLAYEIQSLGVSLSRGHFPFLEGLILV